MNTPNTSERIINAALELVRVQGYKATTTRAIAEKAGVNEVTIFRHFGSKKGILEAAIRRFNYAPILSKIIREEVIYDLERDLYVIASGYHRFMDEIRDFVLIGFREAGTFPEIDVEIAKIPQQLKEELMNYFSIMKAKGKLIETDIEAQVMNFIWLNFGFFISKARLGTRVTHISTETFLTHSIPLFARGLTP